MEKCRYKTTEYAYGFSCVRCEEEWFYTDNIDPLLCDKCTAIVEAEEAAANTVDTVVGKANLQKVNEALLKYYYEPLEQQLNQQNIQLQQMRELEFKRLEQQSYQNVINKEYEKLQTHKQRKDLEKMKAQASKRRFWRGSERS